MPTETNLSVLLRDLAPLLLSHTYVFCTLSTEQEQDCWSHGPLATFREEEGLSVVVAQATAEEQQWAHDSEYRCITLRVYSSLDAVGLTAAVATKLADAGISANVIAATHHDHVLVPANEAERALQLLQELSATAPIGESLTP